jgi:hypothetical protein
VATEIWKGKKRNAAEEMIDVLLKRKQYNVFPFHVPSMFAISELVHSAAVYLESSMIFNVLRIMNEQSKTGIDNFEEIYDQVYKKTSSPQKLTEKTWEFFLAINARLVLAEKQKAVVRVLGIDFTFYDTSVANKKVRGKPLTDTKKLREIISSAIQNTPPTILYVRGKGITWEKAWSTIAPALDALRGMIELTRGLGRMQMSTNEHSRCVIPHPAWMVIQEKQSADSISGVWFLLEDDSPKALFNVTDEYYQNLRHNLETIKRVSPEQSTKTLIADCLRLYVQAMDVRFAYRCFLGLWQLMEAITISETTRGNTQTVVKRIAWHGERLGLSGSGFRETLEIYATLRNEIVHKGIHNVTEEDANLLKVYVERVLLWLLEESASIPTRLHLEEFYNLRTESNARIDALEETARYIKKQRSQKK